MIFPPYYRRQNHYVISQFNEMLYSICNFRRHLHCISPYFGQQLFLQKNQSFVFCHLDHWGARSAKTAENPRPGIHFCMSPGTMDKGIFSRAWPLPKVRIIHSVQTGWRKESAENNLRRCHLFRFFDCSIVFKWEPFCWWVLGHS